MVFQHGEFRNPFEVFPQRAETAPPASRANANTTQMATLLATNDALSRSLFFELSPPPSLLFPGGDLVSLVFADILPRFMSFFLISLTSSGIDR